MFKVVGITTGKSAKNNGASYMQLHCVDLGVNNPNHEGQAVEKIFVWTSPAGDSVFKQPVKVMGGNCSYNDIRIDSFIKPFKESISGMDVITTLMVCDKNGNILTSQPTK
jgi:hypothetical protein